MTEPLRPLRVLTLCLGNICRSPVAEALVRRELAAVGVVAVVDSAGTGAWHVGHPPDPRSREVARQHGLELTGTARQLTPADHQTQDIILAMDTQNLTDARRIAPPHARASVMLMRDFDSQASNDDKNGDDKNVPDPYYGGPDGFEQMYQMLERSARAFAAAVKAGELQAGEVR